MTPPEVLMVTFNGQVSGDSTAAHCDVLGRRLAELSAAERDVFTLVQRGLSNKEIAQARGRSVATVKNQLASVFHKFGVTSRTRLIAWMR